MIRPISPSEAATRKDTIMTAVYPEDTPDVPNDVPAPGSGEPGPEGESIPGPTYENPNEDEEFVPAGGAEPDDTQPIDDPWSGEDE